MPRQAPVTSAILLLRHTRNLGADLDGQSQGHKRSELDACSQPSERLHKSSFPEGKGPIYGLSNGLLEAIPEPLPMAFSTGQPETLLRLPWHALGDSTQNGSGAHRPTGRSPTLTASKSSLLGHFRGPFFDAFPSESHKTALAVTNSVIGQCTSHYPRLPDTTCGHSSACVSVS